MDSLIYRCRGCRNAMVPIDFWCFSVLSISSVLRASIEENCGSDWSREIRAVGFHIGVKQ